MRNIIALFGPTMREYCVRRACVSVGKVYGVGMNKYTIKKARSPKGNICWAVFQGKTFVSAHGDREGAQIAIRYLRGDDPRKIEACINKSNLRWMRNLTEVIR